MEAVLPLVCGKAHHCRVTVVPVRRPLHRYRRHSNTHNTSLDISTATDCPEVCRSQTKDPRLSLWVPQYKRTWRVNMLSHGSSQQMVVDSWEMPKAHVVPPVSSVADARTSQHDALLSLGKRQEACTGANAQEACGPRCSSRNKSTCVATTDRAQHRTDGHENQHQL